MTADPARRLCGATLRVVWGERWPRALALLEGSSPVGELHRDAERTRLEVHGREWWVGWEGIRVLRAVVSDPERRPLLVYAGSTRAGAALTRRGGALTVEVAGRWARGRPRPDTVADGDGRTLLEAVPTWEAGAFGWIVRTTRDPGHEVDVPPTVALWGALILEGWRAPWLRWTTIGLGRARVEAALEELRARLP